MKILIDARSLGTKPSGIGMYIYYLVKELNTYEVINFTLITDVINSEPMKELKGLGIRILVFNKKVTESVSVLKYFKFVQSCIKQCKPDFFWEGNELSPIKLKNPYGLKIVTIYDVFPVSEPEQFYWLYRIYFKYGIKKTLNNFDLIIYDSMNAKKETEHYFPKAKLLKSFVGYIIIPRMPKRDIYDNGDFLYVGNLESRKGVDILLKAYKKYRQKGGRRNLRLAGKIQEKEIGQMIMSMQEQVEGIKYLGYVTESQKVDELATCHAFLFPSRAEGFGIPVVEAMNYNKPIIASNLDTLKEITDSCINFFDLDKNVNASADNLAIEMLKDVSAINEVAYDEVVGRYTAVNTGKRYFKLLETEYEKKNKRNN